MTEYREFGRRLADARQAAGLSRGEVAVQVGVHVGFYGHVERGERLVSLPVFARLHGVLGFDGNVLLDGLVVEVRPVAKAERRRKVVATGRESDTGMSGFGRLLARARGKVGVTQVGLARAVGCSRRQVTRFEGGQVLPSLVRFAQLWRVLGFDADVLLAVLRTDPPPREPFYGFGEVVVAARAGLSLSQAQVARAAGCLTGEYLAIERGAVLPTMNAAVRIHSVIRFDANAALGWVWESGAIEKLG